MNPIPNPQSGGFVRADLVSLLASFALLFLLVVASGSVTRTATEVTVCQNNHRHIAGAWLAHAQDNPLLLNPSFLAGGTVEGGTVWGFGQMTWDRDRDNTNIASVLTPTFKAYVGQDPAVFRCPADRFVSSVQRNLGWRYRVRTVSMNAHVGTSRTDWGGSFPTYRRLQDFAEPSATFVFAEEHPGSINDCLFATDPEGTRLPARARIIDVPASFHNRGAHFSFADGHVELHRWVGPRVAQPVEGGRYVTLLVPAPRDPDALWLGQHAAQLR